MSVNAAPSSKGMLFGMRVTDCGTASATCAYAPRVRVVLSTRAITRSPALNPVSGGALTTSPEISAPGTNGSGGLDWYWPATISASKKLMPVALTLMRTSPSAGSPGSTSSKCIESGPPSSRTTQAFTGGRLPYPAGAAGSRRTRTSAEHGVLYSRNDLDKQLAGPSSGFGDCRVCGGTRGPEEREGRLNQAAPSLPRSVDRGRAMKAAENRENHLQPA